MKALQEAAEDNDNIKKEWVECVSQCKEDISKHF